jgi:dTDP-glucose 4,6-dehydratase
MRHVITGASGFTGQVLARALRARGEELVFFDSALPPPGLDDVPFIQGDVCVADDLARIGLGPDDVVYHLAARQFHLAVPKSGRDAWFAHVNVGGTAALLAAMKAGGAEKLIFFSTDMTYGLPERLPVAPDHPQRPLGPYGGSKLAAEKLILDAVGEGAVRATIFRPRLIAGAGRLGILAKLFKLIHLGLPVPMIGNGANRYQMVAVEDCVSAALLAVAQDCPTGPFNLGSDDPPTVRDLLGELVRKAGSRSLLVPTPAGALKAVLGVLDRAGFSLLYPEQFGIADREVLLDTSATKARLGWHPTRRDEDIMFDAYAEFAGADMRA